MITAIIVDDEQHCRVTLESLIGRFFSEVAIKASCKSPAEGIQAIHVHHPSLVFLDVEMPPSTGFEMLRQLDEIDFEIIFTTAFERYAIQAIKFSALDFLLKPIGKDDLGEAIFKMKEKKSVDRSAKKIEALFENIQGPSKKIVLPTANGIELVYLQDIIRLDSNANYTTFHLKNSKKLLVSKTIKEYEEMLEGVNFFRVHNSHIINLRYVKNYIKGEGGIVKMEDGSSIDVSRRRKDEFLKALHEM
ncbi:MAG TPA: LytTR family DNA-binding domain-containing protein [Puia sp.]|nr:LytTR family DNA-binding domain-containing protein [Puia sp.]